MTPDQILSAARLTVDLLLALVPHEQASQLLDDAAVKRSNDRVDEAEAIKFPNG